MEEKIKSYPRKYNNKELTESIDSCGSYPLGQVNDGSFYTRSSLGLTELQRRNSAKFGWWSLGISLVALLFSIIAVWFAHLSYNDSNEWKAEQLKQLEQINQSTTKIKESFMDNINKPTTINQSQIDKIIKEIEKHNLKIIDARDSSF